MTSSPVPSRSSVSPMTLAAHPLSGWAWVSCSGPVTGSAS